MALRAEIRELVRTHGDARHRVVTCGLAPATGGGVQLRLKEGRAGFAGLSTCSSPACPVCQAKIGAHRAQELGDVFSWARGQGHDLALVTLTVRHQAGDSLQAVWDAVAAGWAAVTSGSAWASETVEAHGRRVAEWEMKGRQADADRAAGLTIATGAQRRPRGWAKGQPPARRVGEAEEAGLLGWVKVIEVTHGQNGWHVHVHAALVLEGGRDFGSRATGLGEAMHERWTRAVRAAGFDSWRDHGGLDVSLTETAAKTLAEYLTKASQPEALVRAGVGKKARDLAREVSLGHSKKGRATGRTPFQIARDALDTGDLEDVELFGEWVEYAAGRRMIAWSRDLRVLAGLAAEELTDEEIVGQEMGTAEDTVLILDTAAWWHVASRASDLLDVTEAEGPAGARSWLTDRGIRWREPPPPEQVAA